METEGSLSYAQEPVPKSYREPDQSHSIPSHPTSWRSISMLSFHLSLGIQSGLFSSGLHPDPVCFPPLPHTCYMLRPYHSSRFDHPTNIWRGVQIVKLLICSILHSIVTSFVLGPNVFLSALFSNALSLCSSVNMINIVTCSVCSKIGDV